MQYRLLGPLEAAHEDTVVDLGSPKQRAVLAVLLANRGRVVSTDRLIDVVWGDDAPPSALGSLQVYISNLRRALRLGRGGTVTSPIVRQAPGYLLDVPADEVDVAEFLLLAEAAGQASAEHRWDDALARAEQALALWRGPFLDDLRDEDWVQLEATGLEELRTDCRETRVTALLALGRVAPALVETQQLRAEHPLRERSTWLHILLLHRSGRSAEALGEYRVHAGRLDEELGLEPGAELKDLQTAVLRQDPALAAWPRDPRWSGAEPLQTPAPEPSEAATARPRISEPHSASSELVGRQRETEIIDTLLADVRGGHTRWLVLTGPAGIGKSRLAQECGARLGGAATAAGAAGAGTVAEKEIWARCPEEDGAPAWWPLRQVVRALGADPDTVLAPPPGVDSDEARFVLYERILRLLEDNASAEHPLLVVIDDVQWADPTSISCLAYLAGALMDHAAGIVLTLRDGEGIAGSAGVQRLLGAVARGDEGNRQLAVPALSSAEVGALASQVSGEAFSDRQGQVLAARTGGNPLFVSEYARLPHEERVGEGIPLAVRSVLGRRLAGLEPAVLQVIRAAAVIGDVLEVDVLAAVTRLDLDTLADHLDDAADERIIIAAPGMAGYAFAHGLLREEVLAGMPAMRRQRMHARVAEALSGAGGSASSDRLSRRAGHLLAALPLVEAAEVLAACRAAALDSEQRFSSETAAQWWEAALQAFDLLPSAAQGPGDRDDLLVARVEALARAGRGQTLLDVVDDGILDAVRSGRTSAAGRLAASLLRVTGAWPWPAYGQDPARLLSRLATVEPLVEHDPSAHVRVMAALGVGSIYLPDESVAEGLTMRAMTLAEEIGDPDVIADALLARVNAFIGIADHAREAVGLAARLVALPHRESRLDEVLCDAMMSMTHLHLGDVQAGAECVRRVIAGSDLLRLPVVRVQMRWMSGELAQWYGRFAQAEQEYRTAAVVHMETELYTRGTMDSADHTVLWDQGRLAEATAGSIMETDAWDAAVAAARGEVDAAEDLVARWLDRPTIMTWTSLGHRTLLSHVVCDIRRPARAAELLDLLTPYTDRIANIGQVGEVGPVALASARLRHLLGDLDGARTDLAQAISVSEHNNGLPSRVRCRLLEAQLEPVGAARKALLEKVIAEGGQLGMRGVEAQARALLAPTLS